MQAIAAAAENWPEAHVVHETELAAAAIEPAEHLVQTLAAAVFE